MMCGGLTIRLFDPEYGNRYNGEARSQIGSALYIFPYSEVAIVLTALIQFP